MNFLSPAKHLPIFTILSCLVCFGASSVAAQTEIRIGLMSELSGPWAAGSGQPCKRGYDLAVKQLAPEGKIGNYSLRFIYADSQGQATAALSEFQRLVNSENIHAVVTNRSQIAMALNPVSIRYAVPLIGVVGHSGFVKQNPHGFRTWPSTAREAGTLAEKVRDLGIERLAAVTLEDEWTGSFRAEFVAAYQGAGGKFALDKSVIDSEADFAPLVSAIKSSDSQAVFVNLGPTQTGPFLKKLHEQGVRTQLFSNYYARDKNAVESAGPLALEGLIMEEVNVDRPQFKQALKAFFNDEEPTAYKYNCYAGLALALEALRSSEAIETRADFERQLQSVSSLKVFDDTLPVVGRELQHNLIYKVYRSGKLVPLESTARLE